MYNFLAFVVQIGIRAVAQQAETTSRHLNINKVLLFLIHLDHGKLLFCHELRRETFRFRFQFIQLGIQPGK
jgi:hypothetical protein